LQRLGLNIYGETKRGSQKQASSTDLFGHTKTLSSGRRI
jgi:hypothetical protein